MSHSSVVESPVLVPSVVVVVEVVVSKEVESPVLVVDSSIAVSLPLGSSVVSALVVLVLVLVLVGLPVSEPVALAEPVLVGSLAPVLGPLEVLVPADDVDPPLEDAESVPSPLSPGRALQPASATPSARPIMPVAGADDVRRPTPQKGHAGASLNT